MTAAYKKKLEEDQMWLAEEKIREARDAKHDVIKAGHMGNFYRWEALRMLHWSATKQQLCHSGKQRCTLPCSTLPWA